MCGISDFRRARPDTTDSSTTNDITSLLHNHVSFFAQGLSSPEVTAHPLFSFP
jgi:hypothetical protein